MEYYVPDSEWPCCLGDSPITDACLIHIEDSLLDAINHHPLWTKFITDQDGVEIAHGGLFIRAGGPWMSIPHDYYGIREFEILDEIPDLTEFPWAYPNSRKQTFIAVWPEGSSKIEKRQ